MTKQLMFELEEKEQKHCKITEGLSNENEKLKATLKE